MYRYIFILPFAASLLFSIPCFGEPTAVSCPKLVKEVYDLAIIANHHPIQRPMIDNWEKKVWLEETLGKPEENKNSDRITYTWRCALVDNSKGGLIYTILNSGHVAMTAVYCPKHTCHMATFSRAGTTLQGEGIIEAPK